MFIMTAEWHGISLLTAVAELAKGMASDGMKNG